MNYQLAISPCPNDTFAFYGLLHGKVGKLAPMQVHYEDIENLNTRCLQGRADFCKISFHAYLYLRDRYQLLESGSALGFGCGPLVVAKPHLRDASLAGKRIAIPGRYTTAYLLLRLWMGDSAEIVTLPFEQIMPAVAADRVDAGLIIHESRFTFEQHGLIALIDLGAWWESSSGHPIPLGGIVAAKHLPKEEIQRFDQALAASIDYGFQHREEVEPFMRQHAQEMDASVMNRHVDLYVNEFTRALGSAGREAIACLIETAQAQNLVAPS